jgi:hypothetical protein
VGKASAQTENDSVPQTVTLMPAEGDSIVVPEPTFRLTGDSLAAAQAIDPARWMPDPKKALWYAIVFPGGGQIYNRKYWKLPLFYGGFLGCAYAINWNNTMYRDYSQAYIDIMDDDPNTKSYENFLPPSFDVNANASRLQSLFKRKKDFYRRYRDLSIFCVIGVYALSIIDAYVDAELSSFDISRNLSMKVRPSILNDNHQSVALGGSSLMSNSYGVQCSIAF